MVEGTIPREYEFHDYPLLEEHTDRILQDNQISSYPCMKFAKKKEYFDMKAKTYKRMCICNAPVAKNENTVPNNKTIQCKSRHKDIACTG